MQTQLKTIIFDLDDTLIDTSHLLIPIRHEETKFLERIMRPLPLMPGARENLSYLSQYYELILLTQGRKSYQALKIQNADISRYFQQICIVNPENGESKSDFFKQFLSQTTYSPQQVLSIGNRPETDLIPAAREGIKTCFFFYGEGSTFDWGQVTLKPDFIIFHHFEMIKKCGL